MGAFSTRVVIFCDGSLTAPQLRLIERLLDNDIQLSAIVVDEGAEPPVQLSPWWQRWHDWFLSPKPQRGIEAFAERTEIVFVRDLDSPQTCSRIKSYHADLGVHLGGRSKGAAFSCVSMGVLRAYPHDARRYRGDAPAGAPETFYRDAELGMSILWLGKDEAAAIQTWPAERFDHGASAEIKCDIAAAEMLFQCIMQIVEGETLSIPLEGHQREYIATITREEITQHQSNTEGELWARLAAPFPSKVKQLALAAVQHLRFFAMLALLPFLARIRSHVERSGQAPVVIFYYHGLGNNAENWMALPIDVFHQQVEYLRRYYEIVSLDEALQRLRSGTNSSVCAVLTFDDGYENFYRNAVPYFEAHQIPATLFVCPETAAKGEQLGHDIRFGYHFARVMPPEEIADASQRGIEIGSHGTAHEDMASLSGETLETAMLGSAVRLEAITGQLPRYFSFPFGHKANISKEAMLVARQQYEAVFSAYGGYNSPDAENAFHFQRISNPLSVESLAVIMAGFHRYPLYNVDRPEDSEFGKK